jgi:hypothetical protein
MQLPGTVDEDDVPPPGGDITTLFVSMATRHPIDHQYLRWHTLDHRPEQHRLSAARLAGLVSTPDAGRARRDGTVTTPSIT